MIETTRIYDYFTNINITGAALSFELFSVCVFSLIVKQPMRVSLPGCRLYHQPKFGKSVFPYSGITESGEFAACTDCEREAAVLLPAAAADPW